jgi:hypothetical protein
VAYNSTVYLSRSYMGFKLASLSHSTIQAIDEVVFHLSDILLSPSLPILREDPLAGSSLQSTTTLINDSFIQGRNEMRKDLPL